MDCNSLVSIIIPVYNVEQYLSDCINSCINQTYKEIEIIIINDGSTDSSGKICDEFKSKDTRIKVIHKENGGLSSARNEGLNSVNGDYICFLDSDDWMNEEAIKESLSVSIQFDADIVFWSLIKEYIGKQEYYKVYPCSADLILFEGETLSNLKRRSVGLVKTELANPTRTDSFISAWGKLYKTSLIKQNNIFFLPTQDVGSEDVPFNIESFLVSEKIVYLNKHYNHYRMFNNNSLTKNHTNTLFKRYKNLFGVTQELLNRKQLPLDYHEALNNRFALTLINNCLSISSPRYRVSIFTKFNDVKDIVFDSKYQDAVSQLEFSYLPLIWKIFFWFGKRKYYRFCLIMTLVYRKFKL